MKAIVQDTYGGPDTLHLGDIDQPAPGPNEVLVQVHAAGIDRGTAHLMRGEPYLIRLGFGFRGPKNPVPGRDVAGTVVQVGSDVTEFNAGDEVFGIAPKGSFAEYAIAPTKKLVHKPANLTFEQSAVVSVSATTAMQALRDVGHVKPGHHVLVIGASGGVGTYAVQLAKALGATVAGVSSTAKVSLVRSLGADDVIDYTQEDFADRTTRYDLILDIGGNSHISRLRRVLAPKGTLVIVGGEGGKWTGVGRQLRAVAVSLFVPQRLAMFVNKESRENLDAVRELIESGQVIPTVDRTYPLIEVPDALRHLEAGQARGKVAISI